MSWKVLETVLSHLKVDMFYIVAKLEGVLVNRSKVMAGFRFYAN